MATTSVLSVSLGLGVSVIADRRSTVVGSPRQLQRERPWEEVMHAGRWELVKNLAGGFLWCALVCAPSPVLASPVRIRIRLLNE